MSPDRSVDVVVVAYESADELPRCLDSLPAWANVVVVDNASIDSSADVASARGAKVIRNGSNVGYTAAANSGARAGAADLILFLNPDASVAEGDLRLLVEAFADDRVAVAGPRLVRDSGGEQRSWWPFPSPAATWLEALGLHRLAERSRRGYVVGTCLLVRRTAFEQLGGFDERFWLYGEETDLCRRAWAAGWTVVHVRDAVARHVGGASAASVRGVAFEHFQRGAEHFVAKHHGRRGLVAHRAGLLVGSTLRLPLLALRRGERFATRRAIAGRLVRVLATHPGRVAP